MAIGITTSKPIHRYDTVLKPSLTITGAGSDSVNRLIASDQLYKVFQSSDSPITFNPLNRTELIAATVRRLVKSTSTLTSMVDAGLSWTNRFSKTGGTGDGWHGAMFTTVSSGKVGLEMQPGATTTSSYAVALQSGTPETFYVVGSTDVEHSLLFGQSGAGVIFERGVTKLYFTWEDGDYGYVELRDGYVRYWLIRDQKPRLLRTTKSLLTYPVRPTFLLYHQNGTADVAVFLGDEASTDVQVYGVLNKEFQDWQNQAKVEPLGDRIVTKDKNEEFTYFGDEKNLLTLALSLEWRYKELYQEFKDFHQYHDVSIPFIFIDNVREKLLLNAQHGLKDNEMFAKFVSPFNDNPLGVEMFGITDELRQVVNPPSIPIWA